MTITAGKYQAEPLTELDGELYASLSAQGRTASVLPYSFFDRTDESIYPTEDGNYIVLEYGSGQYINLFAGRDDNG